MTVVLFSHLMMSEFFRITTSISEPAWQTQMLDLLLYLTFLELETAFLKHNRLLIIAQYNPNSEFM